MPKISMLVGEAELAEIDREAGGNRTAFMVAASIERARALKRQHLDAEIAESLRSGEASDARAYEDWKATLADGL